MRNLCVFYKFAKILFFKEDTKLLSLAYSITHAKTEQICCKYSESKTKNLIITALFQDKNCPYAVA